MFDVLFGWRKASRCKKVIKLAQCRLKLLKNKRHVIVKQLRQDSAHLIKTGYQNIAFHRAEQLIQDETVMAAYELLDRFCEFILNNFSHIRKRKECPDDVNEAVSSLIYASARCGDIPELIVIRKLFEDRYGKKFTMAAVELLPESLVNRQVKDTLSAKPASDEMKNRTINEIAEDYCLQKPEVLALEYYPDWQQQQPVKESSEHKVQAKDVQTSIAEIEDQITLVDSSSTRTSLSTDPSSTGASDISSMDQQALPNVSESILHKKVEKVENSVGADSLSTSGQGTQEIKGVVYKADTCEAEAETAVEIKEERSFRASSSESLPKFCKETIVYLDDIEECQSPTVKDEDSQDQRFYKFKSPILSKRVNFRNSCDQNYWERYESGTKKLTSRDSQRSYSVSRKRSRRRLVYSENRSTKDVESSSYYEQPRKRNFNHKPRSRQQRKQQNNTLVAEGEERSSNGAEMRQKQFSSREFRVTPLTSNRRCYPEKPCCRCCCNHESPCYFSTDEDNKDSEVPPRKEKNSVSSHCRDRMFQTEESNYEIKRAPLMPPNSRRRSYDNEAIVCDDFTNPDHQIHIRNNGAKVVPMELASQGGRASFGSCRTRKDTEVPPYLRAVTMPPERSKDSSKDEYQRSNSCPVRYPNHVHPKLPDYDDLAARFVALKKENMLNKLQHCRKQHV